MTTRGILLISGFLAAASLLCSPTVRGQAPPGPLPAVVPPAPAQTAPAKTEPTIAPKKRTTLAGAWKLNLDESDDAHKKMQEARGSGNSGGSHGGGHGGGYPGGGGGWPGGSGGGWPGGGGGGSGRGSRGGSQGSEADDANQQMRELFNPAAKVTFALKDAEVDRTDDQERKCVFYTDGRKLQKTKDEHYQEFAAKWEGSELVAEMKGQRGKITRSFELSPEGLQLDETLHVEEGRSGKTVVIRYVYDIDSVAKE